MDINITFLNYPLTITTPAIDKPCIIDHDQNLCLINFLLQGHEAVL